LPKSNASSNGINLDKGYEFGAIGKPKADFMKLDCVDIPYDVELPAGKIVTNLPLWEEKTNYYNPEFNFVEDGTAIDGEFQSIQYFGHRMKEIDEWLKVEPINIPDDVCVIGFRGGEFSVFPDLFLNQRYWNACKANVQAKYPEIKRFEVHTDDPILAKQFFPDYKIIHNAEINWRSMRYAKYAIIANSSFFILPRLLSNGITIAPRYWARHNIKEWSRPDNYYSRFEYL